MLSDIPVKEFLEKTSSDSPFPGGGSVSALAASLGAALTEMVARLTIGKKSYASVTEEMQVIAAQASGLKEKLMLDIDRDSMSYEDVMSAFRLPKESDAEKTQRKKAVQDALKNAALVPLDVARCGLEVMGLTEKAVRLGNKNAVTDGLVGCLMLRSAVLGALYNVKINLESIEDRDFTEKLSRQVKALEERVHTAEKSVLSAAGF